MFSPVDKMVTKIDSLFLRRENSHVNRHSSFYGASLTRKGNNSYCGNKKERVPTLPGQEFSLSLKLESPQIVSDPNVTSYLFILGNSVGTEYL